MTSVIQDFVQQNLSQLLCYNGSRLHHRPVSAIYTAYVVLRLKYFHAFVRLLLSVRVARKLRNGVRLGKLPIVLTALFCRCCDLKKMDSYCKFLDGAHIGHFAYATQRMPVGRLNRSLLNKELTNMFWRPWFRPFLSASPCTLSVKDTNDWQKKCFIRSVVGESQLPNVHKTIFSICKEPSIKLSYSVWILYP